MIDWLLYNKVSNKVSLIQKYRNYLWVRINKLENKFLTENDDNNLSMYKISLVIDINPHK